MACRNAFARSGNARPYAEKIDEVLEEPVANFKKRMAAQGRLFHSNWDLYDTRHVVFRPARLPPAALETGYWRAYRAFYSWGSILRGARAKTNLLDAARHAAYAGGWKKFEPMWDWMIRAGQVGRLLPLLEEILETFGKRPPGADENLSP